MNSQTKILLSTAFAALFHVQILSASEMPDVWDAYQSLAIDIDKSIESATLSELHDKAKNLTQLSTKLLPDFVAKQPTCAEYIQAAINASEQMLSLTLEQIERDYHADGKLPPMKQAICYHAKDLLVHPATIAVIASREADSKLTRDKLSHELEEVLVHFNEVKRNAGL